MLPTETNVESGTSQSKSENFFNLSDSGELGGRSFWGSVLECEDTLSVPLTSGVTLPSSRTLNVRDLLQHEDEFSVPLMSVDVPAFALRHCNSEMLEEHSSRFASDFLGQAENLMAFFSAKQKEDI